MQIKISSGERAELVVPGTSHTSAAVHISTKEADRNICEITVENGLVTKIAIREHDGSWRLVATREAK